MTKMQRLRGRIYVQDGAIQPSDLTSDGRHVSKIDPEAWHLLTVNPLGHVLGCARFYQHPATVAFERLTVGSAAIAHSEEWGGSFRRCIEAELKLAREANFFWLEMGGWALSEELRGTSEALLYALMTYAWTQVMGGAIGVSTVTERNGSASILRRLGGQSLVFDGAPLPAYYDPTYRCTMEVLRFDSRSPNPKYLSLIDSLRAEISCVSIYFPDAPSPWQTRNSLLLPSHSITSWVDPPGRPLAALSS